MKELNEVSRQDVGAWLLSPTRSYRRVPRFNLVMSQFREWLEGKGDTYAGKPFSDTDHPLYLYIHEYFEEKECEITRLFLYKDTSVYPYTYRYRLNYVFREETYKIKVPMPQWARMFITTTRSNYPASITGNQAIKMLERC